MHLAGESRSRVSNARLSGTIIARLETRGLRLTEHIYDRGLKLASHAHDQAFFTFVISGSYKETVGRDSQRCSPRSSRFMPAGEAHANDYSEGAARCLHVAIDPSLLERLREVQCQRMEPGEWRNESLRALGCRLQAQFDAADDAARLAIEGLMLEILAEGARHAGRHCGGRGFLPHWLRVARDLLHARFTEPIALDDIASAADVHVVHLSREFRRYFNCTVGDYVRRLRVDHACTLLRDSASPLVDIALRCGFADQSHFSRVFHQYVGVTPAQFRALAAD
jgi:AraC family transcriptional regulator